MRNSQERENARSKLSEEERRNLDARLLTVIMQQNPAEVEQSLDNGANPNAIANERTFWERYGSTILGIGKSIAIGASIGAIGGFLGRWFQGSVPGKPHTGEVFLAGDSFVRGVDGKVDALRAPTFWRLQEAGITAGKAAAVSSAGAVAFGMGLELQGQPFAAILGRLSGDETALHLAAATGNQAIVNLLLEAGANPTARNLAGLRPRELLPDNVPEAHIIREILRQAEKENGASCCIQ